LTLLFSWRHYINTMLGFCIGHGKSKVNICEVFKDISHEVSNIKLAFRRSRKTGEEKHSGCSIVCFWMSLSGKGL
jgi:hypothetical protein